jgi:hypothetical protein
VLLKKEMFEHLKKHRRYLLILTMMACAIYGYMGWTAQFQKGYPAIAMSVAVVAYFFRTIYLVVIWKIRVVVPGLIFLFLLLLENLPIQHNPFIQAGFLLRTKQDTRYANHCSKNLSQLSAINFCEQVAYRVFDNLQRVQYVFFDPENSLENDRYCQKNYVGLDYSITAYEPKNMQVTCIKLINQYNVVTLF